MDDDPGTQESALDHALRLLKDGTLTIDEEGRIWRCKARGRILSRPRRAENVGGKGYLRLSLGAPGRRTHSIQAHRVIWVWFNEPIPVGKEINHKDLHKTNNRLSNLEVVTPKENTRHSHDHGRRLPWSDSQIWRGKPRLTAEQMEEVCALRRTGLTLREIGQRFDRSQSYISEIVQTQTCPA